MVVAMLVLGVANGASQISAFTMAAAFPQKYMGAVMFGNGISGIGTNILRAATLKIFPSDPSNNNIFIGALALYLFAFVVLAACAIC